MQIRDIIKHIEDFAPLAYQESYDNAGLLVGAPSDDTDSALICLDVTEQVIDEALAAGHRLIIAHHPLIFGGLKKINGKNEVERCVIKAIRHGIAIYAAHTNLDAVQGGVNSKICDILGLLHQRSLSPAKGQLSKLVTFIPESHFHAVEQALFQAGAGSIGNYDSCAYAVLGTGSFRAGNNTNPFVGTQGELHYEKEVRLETIFPNRLQSKVLDALKLAHPYEEVAYDVCALQNTYEAVGIGLVGELPEAQDEHAFLAQLKSTFNCGVIRHSALLGKPIKRVAVCGGAGSFLLGAARAAQADIFITGDMKYHDFFGAEKSIICADIGHFESEQFTRDIFRELLIEKIPNFAVQLTAHSTNAVNYFI
ncbi:MAG: Nif3-like dinuclear metal center hexameric protein [Mangrovibacterium sp.]